MTKQGSFSAKLMALLQTTATDNSAAAFVSATDGSHYRAVSHRCLLSLSKNGIILLEKSDPPAIWPVEYK